MTTTENQAREEYFAQISNLFKKWIRTESEPLARKCEEKILSITYDANVALQKRVEELEEALAWIGHHAEQRGLTRESIKAVALKPLTETKKS